MASNSSLIKSIGEAATRKGVDVPETEDKRNAELTAILRDLNATPETPVNGDTTPEPAPEAPAEETRAAEDNDASEPDPEGKAAHIEAAQAEVEAFPFSIAEGKALTCKRGMLAEGDEITAEDLPGGEERLAELVESGHVVKA